MSQLHSLPQLQRHQLHVSRAQNLKRVPRCGKENEASITLKKLHKAHS